ncbi:MAG: 4Fe-4S binding protein [Chloroflexi bacterium]|nr:4Fe-4S binding protein [Chloroflexota bacterium]
MPGALPPMVAAKFVLWLVVVAVSVVLLKRRLVKPAVRIAFLAGGTLLFGFLFGLLAPKGGLDPNPVFSVRNLVRTLTGAQAAKGPQAQPGPVVLMLAVLLGLVWVSNKSVCGWGCPLGLLQDLLHRVPTRKYKPPFWLSNGVRIVAFVALVAGLVVAGLDWIGLIDPFQIFRANVSLAIGLSTGAVLLASLFVYRPWCQFLCPFGLLGWVVEQFSLMRPRINRDACKNCKLCVKACPTQAMADNYASKKLRADCFACGACIMACPRDDALVWRAPSGQSSRSSKS